MRIGIGYDIHALVLDRDCIIGGIKIEHEKGLLGHSDADVLVHAIMDGILGAMAQPDIGTLFPDTDEKYKDISSLILLKEVKALMDKKGYEISNIDCIIMAERPKMMEHIPNMKLVIGDILNLLPEDIGIKATTMEKLGPIGREEGIAAQAVVLIKKRTD